MRVINRLTAATTRDSFRLDAATKVLFNFFTCTAELTCFPSITSLLHLENM